jgi:hypothetical protein
LRESITHFGTGRCQAEICAAQTQNQRQGQRQARSIKTWPEAGIKKQKEGEGPHEAQKASTTEKPAMINQGVA